MSRPTARVPASLSAPTELLIDGEWRPGATGAAFPVTDPASGDVLANVADATPQDAHAALRAAAEAQTPFAAMTPDLRARILRRAADAIRARAGELGLLITLEMGKPLRESEAEVEYAADYFDWYCGEALRIGGVYGRAHREADGRMLVAKTPVGPCVLITPWNFPLAMAARKVAPAIAAGCTSVVKPAEQTPLSTLVLAQILTEAGLPAGVLNTITTANPEPVIGPLLTDPRTRKLSFTGSTTVGRALMAQASDTVLRISLELGGNAPFLVFGDTDLDAAVDGALRAKMRNGGQACTSANRLYVADSVVQEFAHKLAQRMGELELGHGTDPGVDVGPLIDEVQRDKVGELVTDALDRGATALTGGRRYGEDGNFYRPTVLVDVPADARAMREEIFGPVAPIASFADDDAAFAAANNTQAGLVAYIYTASLARALRATDELDTGMVAVNQGTISNATAPFGGTKQSGLGREGGREGIEEYLETKYIAMAPPAVDADEEGFHVEKL